MIEDICKHHCTSCMNQARDVLFSCVECEDFSLCLQVRILYRECKNFGNLFHFYSTKYLVLCIWYGNWST